MAGIELTNMIMIENPGDGKVAVIHRTKNWRGYAFPGGHVEKGESMMAAAVREAYEETGLTVRNLHFCGTIHWCRVKSDERYLVYLYKTTDFTGEFKTDCDEGELCWMEKDSLAEACTGQENDFVRYLPMFFEDRYSEAFALWDEDIPTEITYL